eukprot:5892867-Lingulodinium_polyedra.AAC.1
MSMAVAGSYNVPVGGKEVLFAPLGRLVDHVAAAEMYVVKHNTGASSFGDAAILERMRTIDESIRN